MFRGRPCVLGFATLLWLAPVGCGDPQTEGEGDTAEESEGESGGSSSSQTGDGDGDGDMTGDGDGDMTGDGDGDGDGDTGEDDRPTYYVSLAGDDQNPGTEDQPWRTVQHAADTLVAGERVIVEDGDYGELVVIETDGADETRISYETRNEHGAKLRGVTIRADFVDLEGFEVEADLDNLTGVFVDGASEVVVENNYVHDCPLGGIDVSGTSLADLSSDVEVRANHMHHNANWGLHVVGSRVLVEDNEISESVQHHPKGDPPNFDGADADGMRIFGDNHIVRGNFIHDISDPADAAHNIDPHADCIQTWDRSNSGGRPVMTDSIIEGNHCIIQHPSGKGLMMTAIDGNACHHVTVRNNVFEFRDVGVKASDGQFHDIYIYNNVFKATLDDGPWGTAVHLGETAVDFDVRNNIMVDCHAESRKILSVNGVVDHNLAWWSSGQNPGGTPGAQANELWGVDPMFVDYDGSYGGDYHLQPGSPAIDAGDSIDGVDEDHDGNPRPEGGSHDIGAYEFQP